MRSPTLARLYLQCAPDDDIENWPDARIWQELHARIGGTRPLARRHHAAKGHHRHAQLRGRAYAVWPAFSRRRLRAHPAADRRQGHESAPWPTCWCSSRAIDEFYRSGRSDLLERYSATCLRRVWKAQRFSWWMTQLFHLDPSHNAFDRKRQLAELDYVTSSEPAGRSLAENYAGLPVGGCLLSRRHARLCRTRFACLCRQRRRWPG